jgi:hypothetical protein
MNKIRMPGFTAEVEQKPIMVYGNYSKEVCMVERKPGELKLEPFVQFEEIQSATGAQNVGLLAPVVGCSTCQCCSGCCGCA